MKQLAEQIIVDIIKNEMELADDRVFIRDQNLKFNYDTNLYVIVGMISEQPFSSTNETVPYLDTFGNPQIKQVQQVITQEFVQIDILSRNTDAIFRRWEILAALSSIYAQQKQEENSFRIFRITQSFNNTSGSEGGSNLNKFSITVPCHVWYRKEKEIKSNDYYDDFTQRVDTEQTIGTPHGIVEFEIKAEET